MPKQYHFWPGEGGMDAWDVDRLVRLGAGLHRVARALLESRTTIRATRFRELPEPDYRGCRPGALPY